MKKRAAAIALAFGVLSTVGARADITVTYTVAEKPLKSTAQAGTLLTYRVYADSNCTDAIDDPVSVPIETAMITRLRTLTPRGAAKPPATDELHIAIRTSSPEGQYVKVTGPGITPVGSACQLIPFTRALTPDEVRSRFYQSTVCPGNDPDDKMVMIGSVCVDQYKATIWDGNHSTVYGQNTFDLPCDVSGQSCALEVVPAPGGGVELEDHRIFARSLPDQRPSTYVSWFQAQQACQTVGKRLLTNAEWQMAVAGTPDSCASGFQTTGSRANCVSNGGVFDMVSAIPEWVADWVDYDATQTCGDWTNTGGLPGHDASCFGGAGGTANGNIGPFPAALVRGAGIAGANPGVFTLDARVTPQDTSSQFSFRCAR